jgi:hypothetical protein
MRKKRDPAASHAIAPKHAATSGTLSDDRVISAELSSLPDPLLSALAVPGIDATRFGPVKQAFGELTIDGQVDLAKQLIAARSQYIVDRRFVGDSALHQGACRERLSEIGRIAERLQRLLRRDGLEHQTLSLHPAITLALPRLFQCRSDSIWDQGLSRLTGMLADLVRVGAQADEIFPAQFPRQHGGKRRDQPNPATHLVEQLIEIYERMRLRYPESGPPARIWRLAKTLRASRSRFCRQSATGHHRFRWMPLAVRRSKVTRNRPAQRNANYRQRDTSCILPSSQTKSKTGLI